MCRWLRRGGRGESQKPDLNEREWPLALLYGVGVWQQPEQRPLWLIGLIWQQGKKRSLGGPSGYSFHHLSRLIWTHSPALLLFLFFFFPLTGSRALRFTFPLSRFNNRPSSSNQGIAEPSEVTWLSKLSLSISQMYMETQLPGALEWACSEDLLHAVCTSCRFLLIYPLLFFFSPRIKLPACPASLVLSERLAWPSHLVKHDTIQENTHTHTDRNTHPPGKQQQVRVHAKEKIICFVKVPQGSAKTILLQYQ